MMRLVSLPVLALAANSLGEMVDANFDAKQKASSVPSTEKKGSASQGSNKYINYNYLMSSGMGPPGGQSGGSPGSDFSKYMGMKGPPGGQSGGSPGGDFSKYMGGMGPSSPGGNASTSGGQGTGPSGGQSGGSPGGDFSKYMGGMGPSGSKSGGSPPGGPSKGGQGGGFMSRYAGGFMGGGAGSKVGASATSPVADKAAAGAATLLAESDRDAEGRHTNLIVLALSFVAFGWMGLVTFAQRRGRSAISDPLLQREVVGARGPMYLA